MDDDDNDNVVDNGNDDAVENGPLEGKHRSIHEAKLFVAAVVASRIDATRGSITSADNVVDATTDALLPLQSFASSPSPSPSCSDENTFKMRSFSVFQQFVFLSRPVRAAAFAIFSSSPFFGSFSSSFLLLPPLQLRPLPLPLCPLEHAAVH
eukprot:GABV01008843.1.p2 GENE.GABV01008843.1~~GABV01008843.1.p2  ORF type:complete len:152 (-),score=48.02 GABV01008843.1:319-774(-)